MDLNYHEIVFIKELVDKILNLENKVSELEKELAETKKAADK